MVVFSSFAVLLKFPVSVVERTHLSCLEPAGDAVEMEPVLENRQLSPGIQKYGKATHVADAPSDGALFTCRRLMVRLTLDACSLVSDSSTCTLSTCELRLAVKRRTQIHDVVATDGTVVDSDIPCPERNSVPLLDLKALLPFAASLTVCVALLDFCGGCLRVDHLHVGHVVGFEGSKT